jgi:hypothetical protein
VCASARNLIWVIACDVQTIARICTTQTVDAGALKRRIDVSGEHDDSSDNCITRNALAWFAALAVGARLRVRSHATACCAGDR